METISSCCPDEGLQPQIAGQGGVQRIHHVDILNILNKTLDIFAMSHRQGSVETIFPCVAPSGCDVAD
jgi:hypothetical protein